MHARVRRRPALAIEATVALARSRARPLAAAAVHRRGARRHGRREGRLSGRRAVGRGERPPGGPRPHRRGRSTDRLHGFDARARLKGEIDVARWPQLWSRAFKSVTGALAFDLTVVPTVTPRSLSSAGPRLAGNVRVGRALALRTARWPAPITLGGGGRLDLDGDALTLAGLHRRHARPARQRRRRMRRSTSTTSNGRGWRSALEAELDAAHFPVRLPAGVSVGGRATVDAQIGGTLGAAPGPRIDGKARLDGLTVQLSPTTPAARASGLVEAHGDTLRTEALRVEIAGVGAIAIGAPGAPASAELASLSPFRLGTVDVPFAGRDLKIGQPTSQLYIPDLDTDLRLSGDGRGELRIAGVVAVAGGSYDSSRGGSKKKAAPVLRRQSRAPPDPGTRRCRRT